MIHQKGLGLPEIMISLFLTGFILSTLMSVYISTKQHVHKLQMNLDDDMELMVVTDVMRDSIQQAGFTPCSNIDYLIHDKDLVAIHIGEGLRPTLQINRMGPQYEPISQMIDATHVMTASNAVVHTKHPVLIADCYHAEVHHVKTITLMQDGQRLSFEEPIVYQYQPPVFIGDWISERFYIRAGGGLFYERFHRDELTPLVQTMQLDGDARSGKPFLRVTLGLTSSRVFDFQTRVRS